MLVCSDGIRHNLHTLSVATAIVMAFYWHKTLTDTGYFGDKVNRNPKKKPLNFAILWNLTSD